MVYVKNKIVSKWMIENDRTDEICEAITRIMHRALISVINLARENGVDENEAVQLAEELFDGTRKEFDFSKEECDGCCKTCREKKDCKVCQRKEDEA